MNQALGVSLLGCLLTSLIGVGAGVSSKRKLKLILQRVGAVYHIGFPAFCRATFGMYGSKVMVAFRGCIAIIWYAVQT